MEVKTTFRTAVVAAAIAFGGSASASTLIDFTDRSQWNGVDAGATYSQSYGWFTASLETVPALNANFSQNFDGGGQGASYCQANGGLLRCQSDGLGITGTILSDEIVAPDELPTITFSRAVHVTGLHFLDLFRTSLDNDNPFSFENAKVTVNGSDVHFFAAVDALTAPNNGGYLGVSVNWMDVTSLSFTPRVGYKDDGLADFALAGIQVIPLPAAGWLLLTALGGMGLLARRRKHADA